MVVWWCGGVVVWWSGGLVVWHWHWYWQWWWSKSGIGDGGVTATRFAHPSQGLPVAGIADRAALISAPYAGSSPASPPSLNPDRVCSSTVGVKRNVAGRAGVVAGTGTALRSMLATEGRATVVPTTQATNCRKSSARVHAMSNQSYCVTQKLPSVD